MQGQFCCFNVVENFSTEVFCKLLLLPPCLCPGRAGIFLPSAKKTGKKTVRVVVVSTVEVMTIIFFRVGSVSPG